MRTEQPPDDPHLDRHDVRKLARALEAADTVRLYKRLHAVLLVARGRSVSEVSEITGSKPWAIYSWLRAYRETRQPQSLEDAPRSGRPRVASEITEDRILSELAEDPMSLGYSSTGWTVTLLAHHLNEKYETSITPRTLRRRMKDLGLQWKRPRYVYADKDPNRAQKKGRLSDA